MCECCREQLRLWVNQEEVFDSNTVVHPRAVHRESIRCLLSLWSSTCSLFVLNVRCAEHRSTELFLEKGAKSAQPGALLWAGNLLGFTLHSWSCCHTSLNGGISALDPDARKTDVSDLLMLRVGFACFIHCSL